MNRFTVKTKLLNAAFLFKKSWSRIAHIIAVISMLFLLAGCESDSNTHNGPTVSQFSSDIANAWFRLSTDLIKLTSPGPVRASRTLGYEGVALYEALVAGMPGFQSLAGQLNGLTQGPQANPGLEYHWPSVANGALAAVMNALYDVTPNGISPNPTVKAQAQGSIQALHDVFAAQFQSQVSSAVFQRSDAYGSAVGQHILDWSNGDGFSTRSQSYTPCSDPSCWQPTPPGFLAALEPEWGQLRTFALTGGSEADQGPPPTYDEDPASGFYANGLEVYNTVNNLTADQLTIAKYWADAAGTVTPPGHSLSMTRQFIEQEGFALDTAAEAYAKAGMAVADAFITCWYSKYQYNLLRPITYIRNVIDAAWPLTPITTPNFPSYTSGHSTQSGAWARVMTDMFGNIPFTDHTNDSSGFTPRSFNKFSDAAGEAAVSRLYAGIHYRFDNETGLAQGDVVGAKVSGLQFQSP